MEEGQRHDSHSNADTLGIIMVLLSWLWLLWTVAGVVVSNSSNHSSQEGLLFIILCFLV